MCLHPHQAVLISRLQERDPGSSTSEDLMKAVQLCDRFLTAASGSQAELEVLKSVVKQTLAKQAHCQVFSCPHLGPSAGNPRCGTLRSEMPVC